MKKNMARATDSISPCLAIDAVEKELQQAQKLTNYYFEHFPCSQAKILSDDVWKYALSQVNLICKVFFQVESTHLYRSNQLVFHCTTCRSSLWWQIVGGKSMFTRTP